MVSGSCAPGTAAQIDWALDRGFEGIRLDTVRLADAASSEGEMNRAVAESLARLAEGRSVALYSAKGPEDPAIERTRARIAESGGDPERIGHLLGTRQGLILRAILERSEVRRVCVAGGDTCGYAAKQLGIFALRTIIPVAPGAPLCRAYSRNARFDGLEISLKGGQNGADDYFGRILQGARQGDPSPS